MSTVNIDSLHLRKHQTGLINQIYKSTNVLMGHELLGHYVIGLDLTHILFIFYIHGKMLLRVS